MQTAERLVDTPTVAWLKLRASGKSDRPYVFLLTDHDLIALRTAGLSLATATAYACIKGAVRAARDAEWVTLRPRTISAIGRDWRWWHHQTQRLEQCGFIECERHRGRLPRYRLAKRASE